jgi:hypothetical protein
MSRIKLYRIFAIAKLLKNHVEYFQDEFINNKLDEIMNLTEEINNDQEHKF